MRALIPTKSEQAPLWRQEPRIFTDATDQHRLNVRPTMQVFTRWSARARLFLPARRLDFGVRSIVAANGLGPSWARRTMRRSMPYCRKAQISLSGPAAAEYWSRLTMVKRGRRSTMG